MSKKTNTDIFQKWENHKSQAKHVRKSKGTQKKNSFYWEMKDQKTKEENMKIEKWWKTKNEKLMKNENAKKKIDE